MKISPWFGGDYISVQSLEGTDNVAYSWTHRAGKPDDTPRDIDDLLVWHNCTQGLGSEWQQARTAGWTPAGVGAHTLVQVEPLHIEASVYWPECCGLHGFIRDGRWVGV